MDLVDTHCHLDVPAFDMDREAVLKRCRDNGIRRLVIPGIDSPGWNGLLDLCHNEPGLYPALGLHPVYLDKHLPGDIELLEKQVARISPVAVGEIGLDYFIPELDRDRQLDLFEAQLGIARDHELPVILHVRKAHDTVLAALRRSGVAGGIAHAFNGSLQQAMQYLDLGFKLGFGGTLTWERSSRIRKLASGLPLEAIVLETDAPDMVVSAHRGERNSPEYLPDCLQALAEIRHQEPEIIADQTTRNACEVLSLDRNAGIV